ncbi:hypothetical protein AAF712_004068 [Marasmius tenuissimus]|uniref:Matrin-type domain-containing protein n=1 Tax=Marasmius tenuissimus TaxID=585030 RepID=A0ABR3A6W7_9AGAR|nr:hypothetical protein PM082_001597 [Marasmius tenuissimus]
MSEYWVSKKRYFCKYCDIYIADDAPSRQQHENGLRHKGNRDRFIRGLYKEGEKKKKDLEEEKREMARVERAAQAAFSQDVGAGRAKAVSAPVASSSSASQKPATKPSDPFANYSTAASLGYTDPDAERIAAEQARKQSQGVAGEWQVVTNEAESSTSTPSADVEGTDTAVPQKRPAEEPVNPEDTRHFKLQKRTLGIGLGQIYDPGVITLKPKKKETEADESGAEVPKDTSGESSTAGNLAPTGEPQKSSEKPKWTKIQWKRPEDKETQNDAPDPGQVPVRSEENLKAEASESETTLKKEEGQEEVRPTSPVLKNAENVKKEEEQPVVGGGQTSSGSSGLFRKRKAPNTGNRGRRT